MADLLRADRARQVSLAMLCWFFFFLGLTWESSSLGLLWTSEAQQLHKMEASRKREKKRESVSVSHRLLFPLLCCFASLPESSTFREPTSVIHCLVSDYTWKPHTHKQKEIEYIYLTSLLDKQSSWHEVHWNKIKHFLKKHTKKQNLAC